MRKVLGGGKTHQDKKPSQNWGFKWLQETWKVLVNNVLDSSQSNLSSNQKQTWERHEGACVSREAWKDEGFTGLFQEWD